ncbi:MAG: tetratricopeptide repeat protein [bacterium]
MKHSIYMAVISLLLASCGQQTPESSTATERQKAAMNLNKRDSVQDGILRMTATGKDTIIPIEQMQNEYMRAAQSTYEAGVDYYEMGDLDNALNQFKSSLDYFPENSKAAHYLARIYFEKGEKTLALSYYEDAVELDPKDSVSLLAIGQVYFDMREYDQAMKYYNEAIESAPYYGLAYYNRGTLHGMKQEFMPALDDLTRSIKLNPDNPNAYLNRGLAYFFLENRDAACKDWEKAAEMGLEKGIEAVETYCKEKSR